MINTDKFPDAYKEVYTILQYVDEASRNKIPTNFIDMLKSKMNDDYVFDYDPEIDFEKHILLRETDVILAYIYLHFWADENEKKVINFELNKNAFNENESKKLKYPINDLFRKK